MLVLNENFHHEVPPKQCLPQGQQQNREKKQVNRGDLGMSAENVHLCQNRKRPVFEIDSGHSGCPGLL